MKEIDFKRIRPFDGDRRHGFEELCCQLAEFEVKRETGPQFLGQNFHRKEGEAGDAGVECYYVTPDGDEWGWQAKYFIEGLGPAQWKQIDKSVETALSGHPRLVRYTICLPVNLSDFRDPRKKSQTDVWEEHHIKWTKWAQASGSNVQFVPWGEFELRKRLLDLGDHGAAYVLYWFSERILTTTWFTSRIEEAVKSAGPRYTPEIHVDLPIALLFDAFGRIDSFPARIENLYDRLLRKWKRVNAGCSGVQSVPELSVALSELREKIHTLAQALDWAKQEAFEAIRMEAVAGLAGESREKTSRCLELAELVARDKEGSGQSAAGSIPLPKHDLFELRDVIYEIAHFANCPEARIAEHRVMLLSGEAGTGKTHLLCDIGTNRVRKGLPTVLLLGEKFCPVGNPFSQIIDQLQVGGVTSDEFLGALEVAAQTRGKRALVMVDALNEGAGSEFWNVNLTGLLATLSRFPRVALAVSCRESYVEEIVPEGLLDSSDIYCVRHHGFEGREFDATSSFFTYYGIQTPPGPLLESEFSNPLFLKLLCKGLKNERMNQIPKGFKGITKLFNFFISSVNNKVSDRLGIDRNDAIVQQVVNAFAESMAGKEQAWLERNEAKALTNRVREEPQEYERTLFRNLIHEGLLREDRYWSEGNRARIDGVSFAYERLADHLLVSFWLKAAMKANDPTVALKGTPVIEKLFEDESFARRHAGWVEALSIQVPDLLGKELVHLAPQAKKWRTFRYAFLESLLWRDSGKVSEDAVGSFEELVNYGSQMEFEEAMEILLMVSCDPGHRLNAMSLHRWLSSFSMGDRDSLWSIFLHGEYQWKEEGPVHRIIDWAWNGDKARAGDDVIELCGIVLTWFLTSSHRFLRDHATKALVSMLQERPRILLRLLDRFKEVDDPYVKERLYAVAYGVAMLTDADDAVAELAESVYQEIFADKSSPSHILTRDYARGVIEVAAHRGVHPAGVNRDMAVPPYVSPWPLNIPEQQQLALYGAWPDDRRDPQWALARLYHRIMESTYGSRSDWVIYKLTPACHAFAWVSPESLGVQDISDDIPEGTRVSRPGFDPRLAQRWIMKRILELGWTSERFGSFDEQVSGEQSFRRMDISKPERMGKKYAWIAMREFLGYLSDHVEFCRDDYWRGEPAIYCGPWQISLRDIDPSLLARRTQSTERSGTLQCWWQPVQYQFAPQSREDYKRWERDCSDLIDPLKLIQVCDAEEQEWLTLEGFYDWIDKAALGEDPYEVARQNLWFMVKSYIVKATHSNALVHWINGQSLWGRWMPESERISPVFLGEYPWAPAFAPRERGQGWTKEYLRELPHPVIVTAMEYLREQGYDCSIDETISVLLPSPWMVRSMRLRWSRKGFSFVDGNGRLVAFDPSEKEAGPSTLLISRNALTEFLRHVKCDLVWTVLGEKCVFGPPSRSPDSEHEGHTILQATYRLHNGKVTGGPLQTTFEQ